MSPPSPSAGFRLYIAGRLRRMETVVPLLRASGWLLSGYSGQLAFGLLQSVFLARLLKLTGYGIYVAIFTVVTTFAQVIVCKVAQFVIREYTTALGAQEPRRAAAALKFSYIVESSSGLLVFLGFCLVADPLARHLTHGAVPGNLIRFIALLLLADLGTDTSQGLLMARRHFHIVSYAFMLQSAVTMVFALVCFTTKLQSLTVLFAGVILSYGARAAMLHLRTRRELRETLGAGWTKVRLWNGDWPLRRWFVYIFQNNLGDSLTVLTKSGNLWLAFLTGPQAVALYKIADNIGGLVYLGVRALGDASYPEIVQLVNQPDRGRLKRQLWHYTLVAGAGATAVCLVLGALSPLIIRVMYGSAFMGAFPAIVVLMAGSVLCSAVYWAPGLILAKGRPGVATSIKLFTSVIQIPLTIILAPPLQQVGAAISVSVGRVVQMAWLTIAGLRVKNLD
jgi:O-antigen/teichoic acid export membrane protein